MAWAIATTHPHCVSACIRINRPMQKFLAFLLSFVFALNVAYAGVAGVCDAADHVPQGEADRHIHVGHHGHGSSASAAEVQSQDDSDPLRTSTASTDHCHAHGTATSVASGADLTPPPFLGGHVFIALPSAALISVTPALLERPPRASLA